MTVPALIVHEKTVSETGALSPHEEEVVGAPIYLDPLCALHKDKQHFESRGSALRVPFGTGEQFSGGRSGTQDGVRILYNGRTRMFSRPFR